MKSNHLGNVIATVSDLKNVTQNTQNDLIYEPIIKSMEDYFPFGQKINAFSLDSENYRYGFNAKEKDESGEFGDLTHYDYGFRVYNPAIARFLSVDPLSPSYAMLTPYQFASNRPIDGIDLDGLEWHGVVLSHAKAGVYGETSQKIVFGVEDGLNQAANSMYKFFTEDIKKAETWIEAGLFMEEFAFSSSSHSYIYEPQTPRIDAIVHKFDEEVINGDAYQRSKYLAGATFNISVGLLADKGISKINIIRLIGKNRSKFKVGSDKATLDNFKYTSPKDGWTDVVVHGTENSFVVNGVNISAKELATVLKASGYVEGSPIRLISCNSGVFPDAIASQLAKELGVKVKAPTGKIATKTDGTHVIENSGRFRSYDKNGNAID